MTTFQTIRDYVRVLVGDIEANVTVYSDAVINSHLRLVLISEDDAGVQESGNNETFVAVLTNAQTALLVYRTARSLIANIADTFSYKTPVISIVRRGGIRQLLAHLDSQISSISGGNFAFSQDTFMEALIDGTTRFMEELTDAL